MRGTMTAVTAKFWFWHLAAETVLKVATDCVGDLSIKPAIPEIPAVRGERRSARDWAKHSEMKEADDAKSSIF